MSKHSPTAASASAAAHRTQALSIVTELVLREVARQAYLTAAG